MFSCHSIVAVLIRRSNIKQIQNNDIGPCGSDSFQEWADGISFSCMNGIVRNNFVMGPTDGGIVLFGAPGTQVYNNTIAAVNVGSSLSDVSGADGLSPFVDSKLYWEESTWLTTTPGMVTTQVSS